MLAEDPNLLEDRNQQQQTPLILASKFNHLPVVRLLTCHGANLDLVDEDGHMAFESACMDEFD